MSEEDPKPPELKKLEVGIIDSPEDFEVGLANELDDSPMIVFKKGGEPKHALAFTGAAGEKLLTSFMVMLGLLYGAAEEGEERPQWIAPEKKDKKPTLH